MKRITNCHVIVCGPAVGKTYLAKHDNRFIDLDAKKAKYKYGLTDLDSVENERNKLNRGPVVNHGSSKYIIGLIDTELEKGKYLLLSYHEEILNYIISNNIPFCLVYPSKELQNEYAKRMKDRGNNEIFVEEMTRDDKWNYFYDKNPNDKTPTYKIKLKKGQYLSDVVNQIINE